MIEARPLKKEDVQVVNDVWLSPEVEYKFKDKDVKKVLELDVVLGLVEWLKQEINEIDVILKDRPILARNLIIRDSILQFKKLLDEGVKQIK